MIDMVKKLLQIVVIQVDLDEVDEVMDFIKMILMQMMSSECSLEVRILSVTMEEEHQDIRVIEIITMMKTIIKMVVQQLGLGL